jgi:hypothetical protein
MQSLEIVSMAIAVMLIGAAALYYQLTGKRRFETMIAFCGVALVASGLAMLQDGVAGSRKFLWMMPLPSVVVPVAERQPGDRVAAHAPAPQAASVSD